MLCFSPIAFLHATPSRNVADKLIFLLGDINIFKMHSEVYQKYHNKLVKKENVDIHGCKTTSSSSILQEYILDRGRKRPGEYI